MTNPLVMEYIAVRAAFRMKFNVTKPIKMKEEDKTLPITHAKFHGWPTISAFSYYDLMSGSDPIVTNNLRYLMRVRGHSESKTFMEKTLDTTNAYTWIQSYLSYAHRALSDMGYSVTEILPHFQEIGIASNFAVEIDESMIDDNEDGSDPLNETGISAEEYDSRNATAGGDDENEEIENEDNGEIIPWKDRVEPFPDPIIMGIDPTDQIDIKVLHGDLNIIRTIRQMYVVKPLPTVSNLTIDSISGVLRAGESYNALLRRMWMGEFSDQMAQFASSLCIRILRGYIYVPENEDNCVPHKKDDQDVNKWNGRTTALFYMCGLFVLVYQLDQSNLITKMVTNTAYEILMHDLDFLISRERVEMQALHTYGDKKYNYSLNDLSNQLQKIDWTAILWNHLIKVDNWISLFLAVLFSIFHSCRPERLSRSGLQL